MIMTFPRWRQSLARSLHVQRSKAESKFFQVANAYISSEPQNVDNIVVENRTMVFRGFAENSHTLLAVSDARSEKVAQWQQNPRAQLCWYFTKSREQFRISATVSLIGPNSCLEKQGNETADKVKPEENILQVERSNLWSNLSEKARAQFFWPTPKQAVHEVDVDIESMSAISRDFILVCFQPYYVDYLNLTTDPQTREIHECIDGKWIYEAVNP
jgi:pyridoxamine 5'-phosphate oxidase